MFRASTAGTRNGGPILQFRGRPEKIGAQAGRRAPADAPNRALVLLQFDAKLTPDHAARRSTLPPNTPPSAVPARNTFLANRYAPPHAFFLLLPHIALDPLLGL
jgi:hypothetical protein